MKQSRRIALCGVLSALAVLVLLLGNLIGIGTYAAPLFAGLIIMPLGMKAGKKYHILGWLAVSLLGFMLLSDREEALMFACLFGWYPIARPYFDSLRPPLNIISRFAALNACAIAVELLVMLVLVPESAGVWLVIALLVLANVTFIVYDRLIPVFMLLFLTRFSKFFK